MKTAYNAKVNLMNAWPFKQCIKPPKLTKACSVISADETKGTFKYEGVGLFSGYYSIDYKKMSLKAWRFSKGKTIYISLFDKKTDKQVGQLVKTLDVADNLDKYTLYLIDNADCDPAAMALFVVYYDNWNFGHHGEFIYKKREKSRVWYLSRDKTKFDPDWISRNFPGSFDNSKIE